MKLLVTKEGKAAFAVGIVLVLSGLLMTNPLNKGNVIVSIIIGMTALINAGFELYIQHIFFKKYGSRLKQLIATGIINIIIGLIMTIPPYLSLHMTAYLSGNDYHAVVLGLSYMALGMGIFLLTNPLYSDTLIEWLVAVYLIVAGFAYIVGAFCEPKSGI